MGYDAKLALRVRGALAKLEGVTEIKMMGGLCFTLNGNMCCGVVNDDLVVRVGPKGYAKALERPHARPMDFTGRPLRGFVFVAARGTRTDAALARWLGRGIDFASSLPVKKKKSP